MQKTEILGIPFDNVTKSEAISLAKSYLENGKKAVIVTPNAEIVKACGDDMEVRRAVVSADIILPDGEGVIWAGKKLGTPLKEKVAGVEFGAELCALAAEKNYSIYFLGGKPGVAEKAAKELQKKNPGLSVIGFRDGYFKKSGEESDLV
ncbi:MAG: WecB/TagA/CpsF family glycosyltransferase, partial [Eubacteriales bacterium]